MANPVVNNRLQKPIDSLSLDKEDLRKLLSLLQERAHSACDIECSHIESFVPAENIEKSKEDLRSCSVLKLTITGKDGEDLFGSINEVFDSISFPEKVNSVYVNSELLYKSNFNYYPRNHFEVLLDFSKPKVFDFSFMPSERTPNNSMFKVEGYDSTWVNGVFSELAKFFEKNSTSLPTIHKNSIYDIIVWFFGIPFGFWACYKFSPIINKLFINNKFLESASFVYVFFLSLILLRILFHYFRWVYPMIEFKSKKDLSILHRGFLIAVSLGVIGNFIYDVICWMFS